MKKYVVQLVIFTFLLFAGGKMNAQDDFNKIMSSIQQTSWNSIVTSDLDKYAERHMSSIQSNGSWTDIPYTSTAQTNWEPATHLNRLRSMVRAYTKAESSYFQNSILFGHIVNAFQFWYDEDPRSTNWYQQQIKCPQLVGEALILMRAGNQQVSAALEEGLIARMEALGGRPDQPGSLGSGANKINIATHWVYRGCLKRDVSVLSFGMDQVLLPVSFTTDEGLQHDYSFLQHGPQLYIGGYGNVILDNVSSIAVHTAGTQYAPSDEKMRLISDYALKAYLPVIRGKNFHFNMVGRAIANPNGLDKTRFTNVIERLKILDSANASKFDEAIKRLTGDEPASYRVEEMQNHFWRADYSLYANSNYSFDVRMVSTRTSRNENGNGQNLRGYFLSDGATNITVDGDEYVDIFPVWDWAMIPGTTLPHLDKMSIPVPAQWGTPGISSFVGGVSDGVNGISVFDYNDTHSSVKTNARKSWFFVGDKVLCLGSRINSASTLEVNTTLNQCLLKDDVVVSSGGTLETLTQGLHSFSNNVDWVYHNKVGYVFPKGGTVNLSNQEQTGSWYSINTNESADIKKKEVFNLSLAHGVDPVNDTYAYFVVPGVSSAAELASYNMDNIEIVSCTDSMHVVKDIAANKWYFAFFKAASFSNEEFSLQAANPCVFMLDDVNTEEVKVELASPGQLSKVVLRGTFPNISGKKELVCDLPVEKEYAGFGQSFVFNTSTPNVVPGPHIYKNVTVEADAFLRGGTYGYTNYGSSGNMTIKEQPNESYKRYSIIKFDLSEVKVDSIGDALLDLTVSGSSSEAMSFQWEIAYVTDDSWSETEVTYNNAPDVNRIIETVDPVGIDEVLSVSIKDIVIEEIKSGNKLLSIRIQAAGGNSNSMVQFYTKEHSTSPQKSAKIKIVSKDADTGFDYLNFDIDEKNVLVSVYDMLGSMKLKTTKDQLNLNILKNGLYIVLEQYKVNGKMFRDSYKILVNN